MNSKFSQISIWEIFLLEYHWKTYIFLTTFIMHGNGIEGTEGFVSFKSNIWRFYKVGRRDIIICTLYIIY